MHGTTIKKITRNLVSRMKGWT